MIGKRKIARMAIGLLALPVCLYGGHALSFDPYVESVEVDVRPLIFQEAHASSRVLILVVTEECQERIISKLADADATMLQGF
jgi:hypothetical protein